MSGTPNLSCDMAARPQQTYFFEEVVREFDIITESIEMILDVYRIDYAVNTSNQQFNEYSQKIGELLCMPGIDWQQSTENIMYPIHSAITSLNEALQILVERMLSNWKLDQILFLYGPNEEKERIVWTQEIRDRFDEHENQLNEIRGHFEKLFECVWSTSRLLSEIRDCLNRHYCVPTVVTNAIHDVKLTLQKLILASFVVTKQPRQVIHENVKFDASVRVLLPKFITLISIPSVWILSEAEVKQQHDHNNFQQQQKQKLTWLDWKSKVISHKSSGFTQCFNSEYTFTDLKAKKLRAIKKDVMTEKCALYFYCELYIKNQPNPYNIWTQSLPVTITTNVSQDADGWATITWDNSFFTIGRNSFTVPENMSWSDMKWILRNRFYFQTGCSLTEQHLQYLYSKLFHSEPSDSPHLISWNQFSKIKTLNSTFFNYFYESTKLVRLHLRKEWEKGLIAGFISKDEASERIRNSPPGTFLLRFSDSQPGGISVCSFKKTDNHPPNVDHMDPYMHNDFERTSPSCTVGDMIRHLNHYTHLYPNIPKGVAFNGFYSESKSSSDRYSLKKRSN